MSKTELRQAFIDTAKSQLGYRALSGKNSVFGTAVGYPHQTWGGSFLTWAARESGVDFPPFTASLTALSYFARKNRLYRKPRIGDILFTAYGSDGQFSQPAVAVVTDVSQYKSERAVLAIGGQMASGLPRATTTPDGVYEAVYYDTDVLAFARPEYRSAPTYPEVTATATVRPSHFQRGKTNQRTELLQLALYQTVDLQNADRGKFDRQTQSAYCAWQRLCGKVDKDANGIPDKETLTQLGLVTGLFTVKD